jgi:zinc transport system ATP-binding protein
MERPLGRCSGGEIQRVLLALALNPEPDLLILDEPVSGVDQNGQRLFLDTVNEIRRGRHMAILMVSHDLPLVREYADHVVLLEKNVLTQGTPGEVFASREFAAVFGTGEEEEDA